MLQGIKKALCLHFLGYVKRFLENSTDKMKAIRWLIIKGGASRPFLEKFSN